MIEADTTYLALHKFETDLENSLSYQEVAFSLNELVNKVDNKVT